MEPQNTQNTQSTQKTQNMQKPQNTQNTQNMQKLQNTQGKFLFKNESYAIRGAVFEVYREMGCGFLEAVYQECLEKELRKQNIPFVVQPELELFYKRAKLQQTYKPDLICYNQIILELKAAKEISDGHRAQLHNYLKATGLKLGFLINFGHYPKATIERTVK